LDEALPGVLLKKIEDRYDGFLYFAIHSAWTGYFSSRASAVFDPQAAMMMCSTPTAPQRTDSVAGHVGLELANVVLKKPLKCWANSHWITHILGPETFRVRAARRLT
jgi:hypothetical protein